MRKTVNITKGFALLLVLCFIMSACSPAKTQGSLWDAATYKQDTVLGEGAKEVKVAVEAEEKAVVFTLHTNAEKLDEALLEHELIAGEKGAYGLYVKVVNGMEADYEKNGTYWSLMQEGEPMMTGVSGVKISGGERFELACMQ